MKIGIDIQDALEAKLELMRFYKSEQGRKYMQAYGSATPLPGGIPPEELKGVEKYRESLPSLLRSDMHNVFNSDVFAVSSEMHTLALKASETLDCDTMPLYESDIIVRYGLALLPEPIIHTDIHGKSMSIRAFGWGIGTGRDEADKNTFPVLILSFYTYKHDKDDYYTEMLEATGGDMGSIPLWTLGHVSPWQFNSTKKFSELKKKYTDDQLIVFKYAQAFFRLTNQTIVNVEPSKVARSARKRADRISPGLGDKPVNLVTLRRVYHGTGGGNDSMDDGADSREWNCRWIVSGHWRNQWYPSVNGYKPIWIAPYVKGPDDKELIVKPRVFTLDR